MKDIDNEPIYTGIFKNRESAENAYNALWRRGYERNDVSLMMSEDTRKNHFFDKETAINRITAGAGHGSVLGGTLGAIAGIIAAAGTSLILPGLSLVVAGPLAAGLAGAGAGGFTGSVIGALMGIPDVYAKKIESGIKDGYVVISVRPHNQEDAHYIEQNWEENSVEEIYKK